HLDKLVDIIIDTGKEPTYQVSTILDLTGEYFGHNRVGNG
ncbi:MAG: threonylcarbamoyl-AMP synthase, partial [Dolichospermum sp.]